MNEKIDKGKYTENNQIKNKNTNYLRKYSGNYKLFRNHSKKANTDDTYIIKYPVYK